MEERNFIRNRQEWQKQVQRVFACDRFGLSWIMRGSFVLTVGEGEK